MQLCQCGVQLCPQLHNGHVLACQHLLQPSVHSIQLCSMLRLKINLLHHNQRQAYAQQQQQQQGILALLLMAGAKVLALALHCMRA